jgi:hypothetical protein
MVLPLLLSISSFTSVPPAPSGQQLHIRLTTTVGSYATKAGTVVRAFLIAPARLDNGSVLPAGSVVSGHVKLVKRVGLGIRHETASLDLEFDSVQLPGGEPAPIASRLEEVDNAREHVSRDGRIHGVRATDSGSYRASGYIREILFRCELHARIAELIIKAAVINLPEPEIYLPAGTELTLQLITPPKIPPPVEEMAAGQPGAEAETDGAEFDRLVASLPNRAYAGSNDRPSDLTNILIAGSREAVTAAFAAAGWSQASRLSFSRRVHWLRAIGLRRGFDSAPMSALRVNGAPADMSWEKGLNDVSKRHHIRLWRLDSQWNGQDLWIGAATHDVEFGYFRPGSPFTHKISADVDRERDKVAYDLAFTGCTQAPDWARRGNIPRVTENGTGDIMATDARLAVVALHSGCTPRLSTESSGDSVVPMHGGKMAVFARREILSVRSDLVRNNWFYRGYEVSRWMEGVVRRHWRESSGPRSFITSFRHSNLPSYLQSMALAQ